MMGFNPYNNFAYSNQNFELEIITRSKYWEKEIQSFMHEIHVHQFLFGMGLHHQGALISQGDEPDF